MNRQDFDAAIVDLDGTMVDTLGDFELALGAALAEIGLPPVPRSFIARTVGKGSRHLLTEVLRHAGQGVAPDSAAIETLWAAYQHHYRRSMVARPRSTRACSKA